MRTDASGSSSTPLWPLAPSDSSTGSWQTTPRPSPAVAHADLLGVRGGIFDSGGGGTAGGVLPYFSLLPPPSFLHPVSSLSPISSSLILTPPSSLPPPGSFLFPPLSSLLASFSRLVMLRLGICAGEGRGVKKKIPVVNRRGCSSRGRSEVGVNSVLKGRRCSSRTRAGQGMNLQVLKSKGARV